MSRRNISILVRLALFSNCRGPSLKVGWRRATLIRWNEVRKIREPKARKIGLSVGQPRGRAFRWGRYREHESQGLPVLAKRVQRDAIAELDVELQGRARCYANVVLEVGVVEEVGSVDRNVVGSGRQTTQRVPALFRSDCFRGCLGLRVRRLDGSHADNTAISIYNLPRDRACLPEHQRRYQHEQCSPHTQTSLS